MHNEAVSWQLVIWSYILYKNISSLQVMYTHYDEVHSGMELYLSTMQGKEKQEYFKHWPNIFILLCFPFIPYPMHNPQILASKCSHLFIPPIPFALVIYMRDYNVSKAIREGVWARSNVHISTNCMRALPKWFSNSAKTTNIRKASTYLYY